MRMRAAVLREIGPLPPYAQSRPLSIEEVERVLTVLDCRARRGGRLGLGSGFGRGGLRVAVTAASAIGALSVGRIMNKPLPLDPINEGFDRLAHGESIRQSVLT